MLKVGRAGAGIAAAFCGAAIAGSSATADSPRPPGATASQWAQYQAETAKTILALQPFRTESRVATGSDGSWAALTDLAPGTRVWFLLALGRSVGDRPAEYHLEDPRPLEGGLGLAYEAATGTLRIVGLAGGGSCDIAVRGDRRALAQAAGSGLPYAPLCGGRLYLRNPVAGHRTSLERITDFLRDHVYGGEEIISLVKERVYRDAFREQGAASASACLPSAASANGPRAAQIDPGAGPQCIQPGSFGLDTEAGVAGMSAGRWYAVRDLPGVYASTTMPLDLSAQFYSGAMPGINRPDPTESGALVYLVAFDLSRFDLHFALGSEHPRLDWSPRPPQQSRDANLPGPDGVGSAAPLVTNGMVSPADIDRTVATFAGGFKREHGAFRYGPLALVNHGSHYGFIEEGVIFSKLQPGLATVLVAASGRVELKTWEPSDDAALGSIRYARQNGVPLIEYDRARDAGVPGALVGRWGPGNWSGSASEVLRTLRAGACLQESGPHRFLVYGYFSSATPSSMARVFAAYGCRYAMQLDMNALEHTYLALYVRREHERLVEHLVQGMEQCDERTREGLAPRFLAVPDDRDFFYLTRRGSMP